MLVKLGRGFVWLFFFLLNINMNTETPEVWVLNDPT